MDSLTLIDVEAEAVADPSVPAEVSDSDMAALHGESWDRASVAPDLSDPYMLSLEQWLGKDALAGLGAHGAAVLKRAVERLPEPQPSESFVWDAVRTASDIPEVAAAVVEYRRVDPWALGVIDAMGANQCFRRTVRNTRHPADARLAELLEAEASSVAAVDRLAGQVDSLTEAMDAMFGEKGFSVAQATAALGAAGALRKALPRLAAGFVLERAPLDHELEGLDGVRRRAVATAAEVRRACSVDPLIYARGVMAGIRRSLDEKKAGDFAFAVDALGGEVKTREALIVAGRAFSAFFAADDAFAETAKACGYSVSDEPALLCHVLARRCLVSGARAAGVQWGDVAPALSVSCRLDAAGFAAALDGLGPDGMGGRLAAVCRDRSQPVEAVSEAARRLCVERRYWLEAGRRVIAARPEATVGEVRKAMEFEPGMADSWERLVRCGATSRADVEPLERHVEWMISAWALPVPDEAVARVVDTRGEVLPLPRAA